MWEDFAAVRNGFLNWCMDAAEEHLGKRKLPEGLKKWQDMPDAKLGQLLVDKLQSRQAHLRNEYGQKLVVELMIAGAAIEQPELCALCIALNEQPTDRGAFCEYLDVLLQLAKRALEGEVLEPNSEVLDLDAEVRDASL